MTNLTDQHGLRVADALAQFIEAEALPGTGVEREAFWKGFSAIVHDLAPKNRARIRARCAIWVPTAPFSSRSATLRPRPRACR
jgi:malate synthase